MVAAILIYPIAHAKKCTYPLVGAIDVRGVKGKGKGVVCSGQGIAIAPYSYKMVRGIDFYSSLMAKVAECANIHFVQDEVRSLMDEGDKVTIEGGNTMYTAKQAFSSLFDYGMVRHQNKFPVLQQHFLGWFITTENPVFDADTATYMDFSVPQKGNTRFMYVLPTSPTEALVEYTLFSEERLPMEAYETAIADYTQRAFDVLAKLQLPSEKHDILYAFGEQLMRRKV